VAEQHAGQWHGGLEQAEHNADAQVVVLENA
jgi:hypothetical protein